MTPEQVVQHNLDAYNDRDIDAFISDYSEEIELYSFGVNAPSAKGLAEIRKIYQALFDASPQLYSTIIKRIVFENKVIDHESISGRMGKNELVEMVLIYEVKEEKIIKITAIKKGE